MGARPAVTLVESPSAEGPRRAVPPRGPRTLDDLARLSFAKLHAVYRDGWAPAIEDLEGRPTGRMLALRGPLGWWLPRRVLGTVARSPLFPWRGKAFRANGARDGEGVNRALGFGDVYRFETRVEDSVLDGRPCLRLDYDLPQNPFFIREIRDELREVAPGLFLGPAMLDRDRRPVIVWFALARDAG